MGKLDSEQIAYLESSPGWIDFCRLGIEEEMERAKDARNWPSFDKAMEQLRRLNEKFPPPEYFKLEPTKVLKVDNG